jgi:predicted dehydrogenase
MLKVGIVGLGFMGRMHLRCWKGRSDARVIAVCDADSNLRENAKNAVGNIAGAEGVDFGGIEWFSDIDAMLDQTDVDVISLTLPTYLHAELAEGALSRGVHVLCEKPMALTVADCDRMIQAARRSGKVLQIGHCVRFWPEYAKTKEIVDSGEYGKVVAATFQRLGSPPNWSQDNWFADEGRSGGVALDLHIHDTDFVQYLFGIPEAVYSHAARMNGRMIHIVTQYAYGDDKAVSAEGSWGMMPSFGFEMSFNIVLEKATIVYDLTRQPVFRICLATGEVLTPEVAEGDGYTRQIEHFAKVVRGDKVEKVITLAQSRDSVRIVQAEKQSADEGRPIAIE